jgi:hypothetical protein
VFRTRLGWGTGVAHCDILGLLVVSRKDNTLSVYTSPRLGCGDEGFVFQYFLGGAESPAPLQFQFEDNFGISSGYLAFTGCALARNLLVTDAGHDAVHVIDVVYKRHVGFVAAPGTITGPRGVAARDSWVAVSAWRSFFRNDMIQIFEGSGAVWTRVRVVEYTADGVLSRPWGLRFTRCDEDGGVDDAAKAAIVVADSNKGRLCMFRVRDGSFVRHVATGLYHPVFDVEEFDHGWLVAGGSIEFVNGGELSIMTTSLDNVASLATVRGVGMVVRERWSAWMSVFATYDALSMAAMRIDRVGWMMAVVRSIMARNANANV